MMNWDIVVSPLIGLAGVVIGAWLIGRLDRNRRKLEFIERQLGGFYSPMLGLRNEVHTLSELRVKIQKEANKVWKSLCEEKSQIGRDSVKELMDGRGPEFGKITDYDNEQLREKLLPAYRQMVKLFRENLWLADPDTTEYYPNLVEFVELWERWISRSIPREVMMPIGHSEETLKGFYEHIQRRHDDLRRKLETGDA